MSPLELDERARELAVSLTQRLVQIPSPYGEEGALGAFLVEQMRTLGLEARAQDVEGERKNAIGVLRGRGGGQSILLQGHMDTMHVYEMADPFAGRLADGRIHGRGAADMKGAIACMIAAADLLRRQAPDRLGDVILAFTVDEESQKKGIFRLVADLPRADVGICGEASSLKLGIGCKGNISIRIDTLGKQAHGSTPEKGVNAINKMARLLVELEKLELDAVDIPGIGRLPGTMNVGVIQGGHHFMFVPDACSVWIDRRLVPGGLDAEGILAQIRQLIARLQQEDPGFRARTYIERQDWNWEPIMKRTLRPALVDPASPPVQLLARAHRQVMGKEAELFFVPAWTELDFLNNEAGIPTMLYGPGHMYDAHSNTEAIEVDHLHQATHVYALAAAEVIAAPAEAP